ncbi:hypothetical protein SPI_05310 [Niveomyces insectorum RCEF 264]|uniref:Ubiquitin 3 binding protein But2 C-terminal domain-containing protein n=1 Tax=Niveomyces insectorum RCEF 264 TaxID=1081102 RepID=A0A167U6F2_9HYPO|nr:hypothetical protein SPI_05310 [Niveomyces insectorum RCEF 264]
MKCLASFFFLATASLLAGCVAAVPTPVELAPRCGTTYYPTILQQLSESSPDTVGPNRAATDGDFYVGQTVTNGVVSGRTYQLVGFQGIAPGSYGCQLVFSLPASYPIATGGAPTAPPLNVTTVLRGNPAAIAYPNTFSFNAFPAQLAPGPGLFGTVVPTVGGTAVINSESCDPNLAFVFSVAGWTSQTASLAFAESHAAGSPVAGVYLTANC